MSHTYYTHHSTRYNHGSWDDEDKTELGILYYGDLTEDNNGDLLEVPFTVYSDYSGGTVERANCNEFLRLFGDLPGVWEMYGGYGTRGVYILRELYDNNEEIKDVIDGLEDYPLINDEALSELEMELEDEAWDSWVKYDLTRELDRRGIEYTEDDDELYQQFRDAAERSNEYAIFEDAVSAYYHIDRIVDEWES